MQKDSTLIGNEIVYVYKHPNSIKQIDSYEEGVFITYTLFDLSFIAIRIGANAETAASFYDSTIMRSYQTGAGKKIFTGQRKDSTYCKEISSNVGSLMYNKVKSNNKKMFDFVLDNISIVRR